MPSSLKTSLFARNVQLNALAVAANHGWLKIYSGNQPPSPEIAPFDQVCLCMLRLNRVAFAPSQLAILVANPITDDLDARAGGKATWYRVFQSDGITALWDGSVGLKASVKDKETGARDPDLVFNSVDIQQHAKVSVTNFSYSIPQ